MRNNILKIIINFLYKILQIIKNLFVSKKKSIKKDNQLDFTKKNNQLIELPEDPNKKKESKNNQLIELPEDPNKKKESKNNQLIELPEDPNKKNK